MHYNSQARAELPVKAHSLRLSAGRTLAAALMQCYVTEQLCRRETAGGFCRRKLALTMDAEVSVSVASMAEAKTEL